MTEPTLDQQIIEASRELSAALRGRPRDQAKIDAARARLDELMAQRDAAV